MRAEIIAIGDELSTGQRLDTNSQWLAERLTELGVDVMFHTTVGDDLDANVAVFRAAIDRADLVVCTGGLGPTADDLTREAIAAATGAELVQDEASLAHIRSLFTRRGYGSMPERNVVQAMFPRGSQPVANPHGTAPGINMTIPRECCQPCRLFALPGVPAELIAIWRETVAPAILAMQTHRRVTMHRRIKCFGAGESKLEAMLPDMIRRGREPRVGITVSDTTITLRITASGPGEAACRKLIAPTEAQIRELLGALVFGEEEDELQHAVVRLLLQRHETVAVAECATDGLVDHWLADADAASSTLVGGVVLHEAASLAALLGITDADPASAAAAEAMARVIRERTGADYGLAVAALPKDVKYSTGEELEGTLQMALATSENVRVKGFPLSGHPAIVRTRAAKQALNMLRLALLNHATIER
ncbi:MAG: CinA family nicotinamide mononucleotide deamidase-related protein [Pirellulales bacterium]